MSPPSACRAGRRASIAASSSGSVTAGIARQAPASSRPGSGTRVDVGAERPELAGQVGVAAVDVVGVDDGGLAVGGETGEQQGGAGPHVAEPAPARPRGGARRGTTAWRPSVRTSAPMRSSSPTNTNRLSKTFSVTIAVPSATAMRRDRDRHEVGREAREAAASRRRSTASDPSARAGDAVGGDGHDGRPSRAASHHRLEVLGRDALDARSSPPAIAHAKSSVPASMRSPMIVCSVGSSSATPSTTSVERARALDAARPSW